MDSAWLFPNLRVLIRGAGDLASGVAYRLVRAGLPTLMLERATPLFVRRYVSYGNAIYEGGTFRVEGIESHWVSRLDEAENVLAAGAIPILVDEEGDSIRALRPQVVVDVRMQKERLDTCLGDAPLVVALGPGYVAGEDCHAVIETQRGHTLGRVYWSGSALPDTGTPGVIAGYASERVLRAPAEGYVLPTEGVKIGGLLKQGDLIATLNGHSIYAPFDGVLRGLVHPSLYVWTGLKIGDLDARGDPQHCFTHSDKTLALGGGVLEAIFSAPQLRPFLRPSARG
jgi:xanthine dehydrogenase accessory factor